MQSLVELATIGHDRIGPRTRQPAGPQNGSRVRGTIAGTRKSIRYSAHTSLHNRWPARYARSIISLRRNTAAGCSPLESPPLGETELDDFAGSSFMSGGYCPPKSTSGLVSGGIYPTTGFKALLFRHRSAEPNCRCLLIRKWVLHSQQTWDIYHMLNDCYKDNLSILFVSAWNNSFLVRFLSPTSILSFNFRTII